MESFPYIGQKVVDPNGATVVIEDVAASDRSRVRVWLNGKAAWLSAKDLTPLDAAGRGKL